MLLLDWLDGICSRLCPRYSTGRASRWKRRVGRSRRHTHATFAIAAETLEVRKLLSQAIPFDGATLVIPGTAAQTAQYHFEFTSHDTAKTNEIGI